MGTASGTASFDLVILNGRVVDPATRSDAVAHLAVRTGRIAALVPPNQTLDGSTVIDAAGLVVAPGFIDIHCHEDAEGYNAPEAGRRAMSSTRIAFSSPSVVAGCRVRDGVTTIVGGNCGFSYHPLADYFDKLEEEGCLTNYGSFAGHNVLREAAGAYRDTTLDPEQGARLVALAEQDLAAGALGISYGVAYSPAASREEILAAAKVAADAGGLIAAHTRHGEDSPRTLEALREFLQVSRETGVPFQLSHIASTAGHGEWLGRCLEEIDAARREGLRVAADAYPYCAGMGMLGSAAFDEGVFERWDCTPGDMEVAAEVVFEGRTLMRPGDRFTAELWDLVRPLVLKGRISDPGCVAHMLREDRLRQALSQPYVMVGSDALVIKDTQGKASGHPRVAGTCSRFLGRYVREQGLVDLMTGLYKCATLPAATLGLANKGRLAVGADADIVVFDADAVSDAAAFGTGFDVPPRGVEYVVVNGAVTVRHGEIVPGVMAGRVLRRDWRIS